ncbi:MAG: hypothetical protein ABIT71_14235 [Vicinamibacteraceae bacterium]
MLSPDGSFTATCVPAAADGQKHGIVVANRAGERVGRKLAIERHAEFTWSPRGNLLAVTDAPGSTESNCLMVDVPNAFRQQDVSALIAKPAKASWKGHWYCKFAGWSSPTVVRVRSWGYDDATHSFDRSYSYDVLTGRLDPSPPPKRQR